MLSLLPLLLTLHSPARAPADSGLLSLTVDSSRKEVVIVAGPFDVAAGHAGHHGAMMHEDHAHELPLLHFRWPVNGWLRGLKVEMTDGDGRPVERRVIHHFNLINFSRRQLFYPAVERTVAVGQETGDLILPKGIGVPMQRDAPLALIFMFHNERPDPISGLTVKLTFLWMPTTMTPRPIDVMPVYMDVMNPIGQKVSFDLPAGPSTWEAEFPMPLSGRIIGVGGHAHDYATGIMLQDLGTDGADSARPRTVVKLETKLDQQGMLLAIDRKLPGVAGEGIKLVKGREYRLVGTYDNPTGELIPDGAMIHLAYLFAPGSMADWPELDPDDPGTEKDLAFLAARGSARADATTHDHGTHDHGEHQHPPR